MGFIRGDYHERCLYETTRNLYNLRRYIGQTLRYTPLSSIIKSDDNSKLGLTVITAHDSLTAGRIHKSINLLFAAIFFACEENPDEETDTRFFWILYRYRESRARETSDDAKIGCKSHRKNRRDFAKNPNRFIS